MSDGAHRPPSPPLPEDEHFEIVLSVNEEDLTLFEREYVPRRGGCLVPITFVCGSIAVGALVVVFGPELYASAGAELPWVGRILLGAAVAALVAVAAMHLRTAVGKLFGWRDTALDTNGWLLVTVVDGLWLQSVAEGRLHLWSAFKEMIVSDGAIYLGFERRKALILPRRVFGDRNDFHTFVSIMAKYAHI